MVRLFCMWVDIFMLVLEEKTDEDTAPPEGLAGREPANATSLLFNLERALRCRRAFVSNPFTLSGL
jgi:hypothetical protein